MRDDRSHRGSASPRDTFITVYGRKPVLAALADPALSINKVLMAAHAHGKTVREILDAAAHRQVPVHRVSAHRVKVLAGNGRHDQGVLADVVAPRMRALQTALPELGSPVALLVLDAITNPANVGMILRTATAAGFGGVVLPRRGRQRSIRWSSSRRREWRFAPRCCAAPPRPRPARSCGLPGSRCSGCPAPRPTLRQLSAP